MPTRKHAVASRSKSRPQNGALSGLLGEQATRSRILRGAATVFARKGVDATTVQDILQASGLSRRTFYQFFRSKDDALLALFEIATRQAVETTGEAAVSDDLVKRMTQSVDAYLALWRSGGELPVVLQTEAMRAGSPLSPLREQALDTVARRGASAYQKLKGRSVDPLVFRSFQLALEGLLAHAHRNGPPSDRQLARVRRVILSIIVRTLATGDSPVPDLPALGGSRKE